MKEKFATNRTILILSFFSDPAVHSYPSPLAGVMDLTNTAGTGLFYVG